MLSKKRDRGDGAVRAVYEKVYAELEVGTDPRACFLLPHEMRGL